MRGDRNALPCGCSPAFGEHCLTCEPAGRGKAPLFCRDCNVGMLAAERKVGLCDTCQRLARLEGRILVAAGAQTVPGRMSFSVLETKNAK